jgi:hypothetical protein
MLNYQFESLLYQSKEKYPDLHLTEIEQCLQTPQTKDEYLQKQQELYNFYILKTI